jgi:hypothetical protein
MASGGERPPEERAPAAPANDDDPASFEPSGSHRAGETVPGRSPSRARAASLASSWGADGLTAGSQMCRADSGRLHQRHRHRRGRLARRLRQTATASSGSHTVSHSHSVCLALTHGRGIGGDVCGVTNDGGRSHGALSSHRVASGGPSRQRRCAARQWRGELAGAHPVIGDVTRTGRPPKANCPSPDAVTVLQRRLAVAEFDGVEHDGEVDVG